jgi:hypothetical protein
VSPRAGLDSVEKGNFFTIPEFELWPRGCPAHSQSLYRLLLSGSTTKGYYTYIQTTKLSLEIWASKLAHKTYTFSVIIVGIAGIRFVRLASTCSDMNRQWGRSLFFWERTCQRAGVLEFTSCSVRSPHGAVLNKLSPGTPLPLLWQRCMADSQLHWNFCSRHCRCLYPTYLDLKMEAACCCLHTAETMALPGGSEDFLPSYRKF